MSFFELIMFMQGYNLKKADQKLKKILSFNHKEFMMWQEEAKWSIAKYHYEHNEFYRKKVGECFPDKWENLPIIEKKDLQIEISELFSKGYDKRNTYISNTSGSSGHPFFFAKNKEDHSMDWAYIKYNHGQLGINQKWKQARFFGIPIDSKVAYYKERLKDVITNRFRFFVYDLSEEKLERFIIKFKKTKFDYIYGYTNSLILFAKYLIEKKTTLTEVCPTLKYCICTSENLTEKDRILLQNGFGVRVFNEYGASETKIIAFETNKGEMVLGEDVSFIETVNKGEIMENKQAGNIIITDLFNKAMPFIRYNIGDIGVISKDLSSNRKHRKLEQLLGRENDNIILPSGKISPGLTLYYVSRSFLESSGVIKEFMIKQTKINEFIFEIVSDEPLTKNQENDIKNKVGLYLEFGLNIIIRRVKKIYRPPSGKIKHFYSEIN
jgi:phenylacetate-CoA ligase